MADIPNKIGQGLAQVFQTDTSDYAAYLGKAEKAKEMQVQKRMKDVQTYDTLMGYATKAKFYQDNFDVIDPAVKKWKDNVNSIMMKQGYISPKQQLEANADWENNVAYKVAQLNNSFESYNKWLDVINSHELNKTYNEDKLRELKAEGLAWLRPKETLSELRGKKNKTEAEQDLQTRLERNFEKESNGDILDFKQRFKGDYLNTMPKESVLPSFQQVLGKELKNRVKTSTGYSWTDPSGNIHHYKESDYKKFVDDFAEFTVEGKKSLQNDFKQYNDMLLSENKPPISFDTFAKHQKEMNYGITKDETEKEGAFAKAEGQLEAKKDIKANTYFKGDRAVSAVEGIDPKTGQKPQLMAADGNHVIEGASIIKGDDGRWKIVGRERSYQKDTKTGEPIITSNGTYVADNKDLGTPFEVDYYSGGYDKAYQSATRQSAKKIEGKMKEADVMSAKEQKGYNIKYGKKSPATKKFDINTLK